MSEAALGARMVRHFFVFDENNLTVPKRSLDSSQRIRRSSAMRAPVIKLRRKKNKTSAQSRLVDKAVEILEISSSKRTRSRSSSHFLVNGLRGTRYPFKSAQV